MLIEADALRHDDARQISVFTGNVVITQGSLQIRGAEVEISRNAQGQQRGIITGNPAFFRQQRSGLNEFIEGQALRIEHDGQADAVRLIGNAVLRRFLDARLNDETSGNLITYNNRDGMFTVEGGAASRTPANPLGRVRAMITPTPRAAAPTAPAPAPLPLRPSGELGGARP